MTFFGRMHHLPEVSHQGNLLYSKAILKLAWKLNGGDEAISKDVLAATLTLAAHEASRYQSARPGEGSSSIARLKIQELWMVGQ